MKNSRIALFLIPLVFLAFDAIAKVKAYPFQVKVSGHGKSTMVLIPGFTCSGDVWDETIALL
jgi:hypothetical protein